MLNRRRFIALGTAAVAASPVRAQAFPSRPIVTVVPYAAGGASDVIARLVGQQLHERLGQAVIVENKPGATTGIGTTFVARAPADGHTLLLTAPPFVIGHYVTPKPTYDVTTDFAPICLSTTSPLIVTVAPKLGVSTFKEFIAYARANPGKVNYGSTGPMGLPHLAAELLAKRAGISMVHVPYRGGGPVVNDMLAGQIDMYLANPLEVAPHFGSGLKPLAVTTRSRSSLLPQVPTIEESGIPDFDLSTWTGYFAPAATAAAIVNRLNAEIGAILSQQETRRRLNEQFSVPVGGTIAEFKAFLQAQHTLFAALVPSIG